MEGSETVLLHALNTSANVLLLADAARQPSSSRRHLLDLRDRLERLDVSEPDLRDPESTQDVRPLPMVCLLHRTTRYRTKDAADRSFGCHLARTAQPLALGYVRDPVALLVDSEVAPVAEQDDVCVLAVVVKTDGTDDVVLVGDGVRG